MIDILRSLIATTHNDFLVVVQVIAGDALDFLAHRCREKEGVTLLRNTRKDSVDAFCKSHVQHFVCLVKDDVFHTIQTRYATLHKVDQATRGSHNYLRTFLERADLTFNAAASVNGLHVKPIKVARIILQIVGNLKTEFAGGTQDDGLGSLARRIYFLQDGQAKGCRFSRTCLREGNNIVAHTEKVGDHFFLYGHRMLVT